MPRKLHWPNHGTSYSLDAASEVQISLCAQGVQKLPSGTTDTMDIVAAAAPAAAASAAAATAAW